jgi:glycosyltransferase involved in cell wall biosynthesis
MADRASMAVLEVIVSTQAGGGPQHVLTLANGLRARGWAPVIAGPRDGTLFERFEAAGIEIVELATNRLRPHTLLTLMRLMHGRGIRLVHSHGKGAGLHARLAARMLGVPAVHTFHGLHFERYPQPVRGAYLALERRLARWTRTVVSVSRAQEREALALDLFPSEISRVVLNGVDVAALTAAALDRWDARAALGLEPGVPVIGCAARLDEVKRLDVLLAAAAAVRRPGLVVAIIGAGAEERRLRALASSLGLGAAVKFAGEIPDAARLFRAFDVYAAPSRKEGMPLAVLEAMALGLPVVASDIAAHRELLGDVCEGLVPGTVDAFAARLGALLDDPATMQAWGAQNRTRARSEFAAAEMVTAMDALYRQALGV